MIKPPMPPSAETLLTAQPALASVPYLDQYWGAWAIEQDYAKFLVSHCRNLNLQLHLSEREAQAASGSGRRTELVVDANGIAQINLSGTLMKHCSSMVAGTSMVEARRQVRAAAASADVRGILLVIDSPGGTVAGTADLAADIRAAGSKKPCFAYIEDFGASGAYWLASQAQRVTANATALVGSIGVFTVVEDTSKAAENDGIQVHVVKFGAMKGAGTPGTPVTSEQLAYFQERIDGFAQDFIDAIASGRRLSREAATALADGRVHKGAAAVKLGLVDAVESIDAALAAVTAACNPNNASPRKKIMSHSESAAASEAKPQPQAASIAELKENCLGASDSFIVAQLEKAATLPQAMKAHAAEMARTNAELAKERDELKAKAETKPRRGSEPLAADNQTESAAATPWADLGANEFCRVEIETRTAKGQKRERASQAVFAANPGLREAMIEEANPGRRAA